MIGLLGAAGVLAAVLGKLAEKGQLSPSLWTPFLGRSLWVDYLLPGLAGTLQATVISVIAAGAFGVLFGAGRLSHNVVLRRVCGVIVEVFRAIPVLIMMIFAYSVLVQAGVFSSSLNQLLGVVIALTLYNGSVIAELVRSGVNALPRGQYEAGLSVGLTPDQTLRIVQLPQALVAMLPALIGQLVVVLKDSALGYAIMYMELLNWGKTAGSSFANPVPTYIVVAAIYIALNYAITRLAMFVERRLRRGRHTAGPVTTAAPNIIQGTAEPGVPGAAGYEGLREFGHEHGRHAASAPGADER